MSRQRNFHQKALIILALAMPIGAAEAQTSNAQLEARVRALEARMGAVETKVGGAATSAPANAGIPCHKLNVNGSVESGNLLEVRVNDAVVGTFSDGGVYLDVESFMRPGSNAVKLTFSSPSDRSNAELRCLPPGQETSRATILTLRPTAKRLSIQTDVNLSGR